MALVPTVRDGDWTGLRRCISKLSQKLGPGSVPTFAGLKLTGKITTYNSITTVNGGVPSEVATVDLTGQASSISATTIYTPAANGMFRLSVIIQLVSPDSMLSALATSLTITYTEPDGSVAQSIVPVLLGNVVNSVVSQIQGSATIYAKVGVAIQYAVTFTAASGTYSVHLKLEAL